MAQGTVYQDLMDIINTHKKDALTHPRTEAETELFCERIGTLIDKHFIVKNNLTQEQYDNLWAALPK